MKNRYLLICILLLSACQHKPNQYQGYVEGQNSYLAAPYSGTLINLLVTKGQKVKRGDLLFKLDPYPQQYQILAAKASLLQGQNTLRDLELPRRPAEIAAVEAQIKQAEAQVKLAELRVQRNQTLYNKHVIARDTLDQANEHYQEVLQLKAQYMANLALAKEGARTEQINAQRAQLGVLQAKLNEAVWQSKQKVGYAPTNGIVFDTYFNPGEFVSTQKPIIAILAPENINLEFFVPLNILNQLHVGQAITFTYENVNTAAAAEITYISPIVEYEPPLVYSRENNHKLVFRIKAKAMHPENLHPGQPVLISITEPTHAG